MRVNNFTAVLFVIWFFTAANCDGRAQDGDHMLDGIGETALISRYLFDGDLRDGSRNGLDASAVGQGLSFVEDEMFGEVLYLNGGADGAFVTVPTRSIDDTVNLSMSGWLNISDDAQRQVLFDFGTKGHHLQLILDEAQQVRGCSVRLALVSTKNVESIEQKHQGARVRPGVWVHLAVVLDAAKNRMSLYVNGLHVHADANVNQLFASLVNKEKENDLQLYLGRAIGDAGFPICGRLFDVRLYRSALSDQQIATIRHNAISGAKVTLVD